MELRTIEIVDKSKCTGCSACLNVCSAGAISMEIDSDGFCYPKVDLNKCIGCGLCYDRCPAYSPSNLNDSESLPQYYAFYRDEEIRIKSSSGGMFRTVAEYVIENGGIVCGCSYSDDYYSAYHKIVDSIDALEPLQKSKYFQSNIGLVFREIRENLENDRTVLFSGTPCQVDGLLHFLGKKYNNLITIDIICHGTPSPQAYRKFLKDHEKEGVHRSYVDFRDKSIVPWGTVEYIKYEDGTYYYNDIYSGK